MSSRLEANEFQEELRRLDALLHEAEAVADPAARNRLQEIVQAVLHLHGVGIERLLEIVAEAGEPGESIVDAAGKDDVVSGLLLLHGLHPAGVEERVMQALETIRPALHGNIELVELRGNLVRLRLVASGHSCPSSSATMKEAVEETIFAKAPEITIVEIEGTDGDSASAGFRVSLPLVGGV